MKKTVLVAIAILAVMFAPAICNAQDGKYKLNVGNEKVHNVQLIHQEDPGDIITWPICSSMKDTINFLITLIQIEHSAIAKTNGRVGKVEKRMTTAEKLLKNYGISVVEVRKRDSVNFVILNEGQKGLYNRIVTDETVSELRSKTDSTLIRTYVDKFKAATIEAIAFVNNKVDSNNREIYSELDNQQGQITQVKSDLTETNEILQVVKANAKYKSAGRVRREAKRCGGNDEDDVQKTRQDRVRVTYQDTTMIDISRFIGKDCEINLAVGEMIIVDVPNGNTLSTDAGFSIISKDKHAECCGKSYTRYLLKVENAGNKLITFSGKDYFHLMCKIG